MNNIYYQRPNNSAERRNSHVNRQRVPEEVHESPYMSAEEQESRYYQPSYQGLQKRSLIENVVKQQSPVKDLIANIILVILSIALVIALVKLGEELSYMNRHYERNANSFWMAYDSGRYADSIKDRYENIYNDVVTTAELKQCYAVSEYFEAASLYKAAVVTGKTDKAQEYLAVMEEALEEMGDVEYLAEDINQKLGIADTAK